MFYSTEGDSTNAFRDIARRVATTSAHDTSLRCVMGRQLNMIIHTYLTTLADVRINPRRLTYVRDEGEGTLSINLMALLFISSLHAHP